MKGLMSTFAMKEPTRMIERPIAPPIERSNWLAAIGRIKASAMIAVIAYGADLDRTLARAETSINRMLKRDAQFKGGVTAAR